MIIKVEAKKLIAFLALSLLVVCTSVVYCRSITYRSKPKLADSLQIREGILCPHAQQIKYKKDGKKVATIRLTEPIMIAMADQEEAWGYFQFPSIGKAEDGTLIVEWSMSGDTQIHKNETSRKRTLMMSKDGGKTWQPQDKNYFAPRGNYKVHLRNGDMLQVRNPKSKDIKSYNGFPKAVGNKKNTSYYPIEKLPEDFQGVYFVYYDAEKGKSSNVHYTLNDPGALRYAIDGQMPVVWWGDIRELEDGTLVAGTYPAYYLDEKGKVMPSSVGFYESKDKGLTWDRVGRILFTMSDAQKRELGITNDGGYQEPAFEVLANGDYICVIRTGSDSPMLVSYSSDKGRSWTEPKPFAPNGVKPNLLTLKNGVVVLASGRPGIQVRFNLNGDGKEWTEPIDMMPFIDDTGNFKSTRETCGYAAILEAGNDSFYIVYSDFTTKNAEGDTRKSIWCRKITVKTKK